MTGGTSRPRLSKVVQLRPSGLFQQHRTVQELAAQLGVSDKTVRRRISEGKLIAHRIGGQLRISDRDRKAFIALCRG